MGKEERLRADRALRENHLRKTLAWYNHRLDRAEDRIISLMRGVDGQDPDESLIAIAVCERDCIMGQCKELHKKLYG